jgi:hypothetical protein
VQSYGMPIKSPLTPEQVLALLKAAIEEAPAFQYEGPLTESDLRWLGKADALLEASGPMLALTSFRMARSSLKTMRHDRNSVMMPLYDAYGRAELLTPMENRGAFIPAGDTWNGYAAIVKLIQRPCDDLLVIDPYINSSFFIDFTPLAEAKKLVRCLTVNRTENHVGLMAAIGKWSRDPISSIKPVEVRYAPARALHDRLIIIDGKEVWLITQSLKDIALRSPASVSRAEPDIGLMKMQHYEDLWDNCSLAA